MNRYNGVDHRLWLREKCPPYLAHARQHGDEGHEKDSDLVVELHCLLGKLMTVKQVRWCVEQRGGPVRMKYGGEHCSYARCYLFEAQPRHPLNIRLFHFISEREW
jgi:hypothetical protein